LNQISLALPNHAQRDNTARVCHGSMRTIQTRITLRTFAD